MIKTAITILIVWLYSQHISGQNSSKSRYLSDTDSAYALLERIQSEIYSGKRPLRHAGKPDPIVLSMQARANAAAVFYNDDKVLSDELKASREKFADYLSNFYRDLALEYDTMTLPTRFENARLYRDISKLDRSIKNVVSKDFPDFHARVIFGTIPSIGMNARIILVPGTNDRIILFNEDLFDAPFYLTKVLIQTFIWDFEKNSSSYNKDKMYQQVKDPELNGRFVQTMRWYLRLPQSGYFLERADLEPVQMELLCNLTKSMVLFGLAHEYAHAIMLHNPQMFNSNYEYNWIQEIRADYLGYEIMLHVLAESNNKELKAYGIWGALLMLNSMSIYSQATEIMTTGMTPWGREADKTEYKMIEDFAACFNNPESDICKKFEILDKKYTHPPLWLRMEFIRTAMKSTPFISQIMDDDWDYGFALTIAGHTLLENNAHLLMPGSK